MESPEHATARGPLPEHVQAGSLDESWSTFAALAHGLLNGTAVGKGYATAGDGRPLLDFVSAHCGDGHALGEIVYKVTRWRSRRNPEDLLKVAAWAFLVWDQARRRAANGDGRVWPDGSCPACIMGPVDGRCPRHG